MVHSELGKSFSANLSHWKTSKMFERVQSVRLCKCLHLSILTVLLDTMLYGKHVKSAVAAVGFLTMTDRKSVV